MSLDEAAPGRLRQKGQARAGG